MTEVLTLLVPAPEAAPRPRPSVEQLRTAWALLTDGWCGPPDQAWQPAEPTITILGCHGAAGASTLAVAVATAAAGPSRVLECAAPSHSGLAGVATAEMGHSADGGWSLGSRDQVAVHRRLGDPRRLPPPVSPETLTIVDVGAPGMARPPWLRDWLTRPGATVLVTTATTYGMRHLETVAAIVVDQSRLLVAVRGPAVRRWPKALPVGAAAAAARASGRLIVIPDEKSLSWAGLETGPVPGGLLSTARELHKHLLDTTSMGDPQ